MDGPLPDFFSLKEMTTPCSGARDWREIREKGRWRPELSLPDSFPRGKIVSYGMRMGYGLGATDSLWNDHGNSRKGMEIVTIEGCKE